MNLARLRGNRKNGFCHELIGSTCFALARVLTKTNYIHRSTLHRVDYFLSIVLLHTI